MTENTDDARVLLDLAATVERNCARGLPVAPGLHELETALVDRARDTAFDHPTEVAYVRLQAVVARIIRDVESGHVRSISGLVAQVRRTVDTGRQSRPHADRAVGVPA